MSELADALRDLSPELACELAAGLLRSYTTAKAPRATLRTTAALLRHVASRIDAMVPFAPEGST